MKLIKTFDSWNNNVIDKSLFSSGLAKYNPKVENGIIKYKSTNLNTLYFAEIKKIGNIFLCKIYKNDKGTKILIKRKIKKDLKKAHNYVREYLNTKSKNKKLKRVSDKKSETQKIQEKDFKKNKIEIPTQSFQQKDKSVKTIIRRF